MIHKKVKEIMFILKKIMQRAKPKTNKIYNS